MVIALGYKMAVTVPGLTYIHSEKKKEERVVTAKSIHFISNYYETKAFQEIPADFCIDQMRLHYKP
jgi:hypothetical protein